jgi:hypothetical protein
MKKTWVHWSFVSTLTNSIITTHKWDFNSREEATKFIEFWKFKQSEIEII